MGLDIYNQEPLLGQNLGLLNSSTDTTNAAYHTLTAQYMQNGSLGRRIDVETRVYDNGVAFRYVIPKSTPLDEILIHDEGTGFSLAHDDAAFTRTPPNTVFELPFMTEQPGAGSVVIAAAGTANYAHTVLIHAEGKDLITHLTPSAHDPNVAFEGHTPLVWPWRMIVFGVDKDTLKESAIFRDLSH
jgi:alpha-glucosidase